MPSEDAPELTRREVLVSGIALAFPWGRTSDEQFPRWSDILPTVIQSASPEEYHKSGARVFLCNIAADPTWGPWCQRVSCLDTRAVAKEVQQAGARILTYVEGVGDCMVYAIALVRKEDGSFELRSDDPDLAKAVRTHWCWGDGKLEHGNVF